MEVDRDKIDEVALALLSLTLHQDRGGPRAWKGLSWDVLDRLHDKGWICDPKGKAKSVIFTEEGEERAQAFFVKHFAR